MTTSQLLVSAWDPGIVVPLICLLALVAYGVQFRKHYARGAFFAVAVALFFVALASPIGVLARGYLFSAHMLQHLILVLAVPPLVLMGLPPKAEQTPARPPTPVATTGAWFAGVGAMWIWHARTLCNAAATIPWVQAFQTGSLILMGLAFWRPMLAARQADRLPPLAAMLYLFLACIGCTILGIIVTLSPVQVCTAYLHPADRLGVLPLLRDGWGLTCKADQEVGGLLMWVPACFVYAVAILSALGRYYAEERPRPAIAAGGQ
jgi:putative membrane protein